MVTPNLPWVVDAPNLARGLRVSTVKLINDLEANAYGIATLVPGDLKKLYPDQIAICNATFTPDEDELAWARKLVAAFDAPENAAKGAIALDGRMVERLHADMARRTLAIAAEVARRPS